MTKLTVAFRNSTNAPKSVKMVRIGKEAGDRMDSHESLYYFKRRN